MTEGIFDRLRKLEETVAEQDRTIRILGNQLAQLIGQPDPPKKVALSPSIQRMADIAAKVAAENLLSVAEIRSKRRSFNISHPRQEAMARMNEAGHSLQKIGRFFGLDHTTVLHGIKAAKARRE